MLGGKESDAASKKAAGEAGVSGGDDRRAERAKAF